ncbi:MAG: carbamate kinase [Nocardioides sp.]
MRVLLALGGNAMTSPDGAARPEDQIAAIQTAMSAAARLVRAGHELVVTHGNGPQVGNLLVKNELAAQVVPPVPLDWCGAQTQGTLGFTIVSALESALRADGDHTPVAALVTRTLVDAADPGFTTPTKPIGRSLTREQAQPMIEHGQIWSERKQSDGSSVWRRVVASPDPLEVLDTPAIAALIGSGFVVCCAGGGGIPVVRDGDGSVRGVEAVIDKDLTAALLARTLDCDVLVIATDVDHAAVGWGTPSQRSLGSISAAELRDHADAGEFAAGSMGPKVAAALRFVEQGGPRSVITSLTHITEAVAGEFGTVIAA